MNRYSRYGLLVLACAALAGCVTTNPVTGQQQLALVTDADEIQMGNQQMKEWVQANEGAFPDPALQRYMQGVGMRIARVSHRPQLPYQFMIINSPDLNAATLPGGKTMINRGLLMKLRNEDQLAALMAHEVGHSAAMHIATQITQQSFAQALMGGLQWGLARGGVQGSDYYLTGAGFGTQLVLLRFSREMEQQADALAIDYLVAAGYNPEAMLQLMQILKQNEQSELAVSMFQSHPLTQDRVAFITQRLSQVPPDIRARPFAVESFNAATAGLFSVAEAFRWEASARASAKRKDYNGSERDFRKAIAIFPSYAPFYAHLAFVQLKAGRLRDAQATAAQAQRLAPDSFLAHSAAGIIHFAARDYRNALAAFQAANSVMPGSPTIYFYMAECYLQFNDTRRAIPLYAEIAREHSGTPEGQASLRRLAELGVVH